MNRVKELLGQLLAPQANGKKYLISLDVDRNPIFIPMDDESKVQPSAGGFEVFPDHTILVINVDEQLRFLRQNL
jgi:hypothetical protein